MSATATFVRKTSQFALLGTFFCLSFFSFPLGTTAEETASSTPETATSTDTSLEQTVSPSLVTVKIRTDNGIVLNTETELDTSGGMVGINPTGSQDTISIAGNSALATLSNLDTTSTIFAISDLQYYTSYGSFFLNCLDIDNTPWCGSWQYTVNNRYPSIGLDTHTLTADDVLFLFFGTPRTVEAPSAVTASSTFTATALQFDPETGTYDTLTGYTIGITATNPADPWNPIEIATSLVDNSGQATFTIGTPGTYQIGLKEDYYYPSQTLLVSAATTSSPTTDTNTGGGSLLTNPFSVEKALSFLTSNQAVDGSFGSPLLSDWAALALTAGSATEAQKKLADYLIKDNSSLSSVTDHERRAMALMALEINPYDGTDTNHIEAILEAFDGEQIGDKQQINDDVFALLVLRAAGYTAKDEIISKLKSHLLQSQKTNGSWDNTADMTAAAIQALVGLSDTSDARKQARQFLVESQKPDGGFGNSFSTSWVSQAISAWGENISDWKKDGETPLTYLAQQQASDGGVGPSSDTEQNRIWSTSYAIPAALGISWLDLLGTFDKQVTLVTETASGGDIAPTTDSATSTPASATTPETIAPQPPQPLISAITYKPTSVPRNDVSGTKQAEDEKIATQSEVTPTTTASNTNQLASVSAGSSAVNINFWKQLFGLGLLALTGGILAFLYRR